VITFCELYHALSETSSTNAKVTMLADYFAEVDDKELGWAVHLLRGATLKRTISGRTLRLWAADSSGVPLWLVEESYNVVGDLAETCALLTSRSSGVKGHSLMHWIALHQELEKSDEECKRRRITALWRELSCDEAIVFNKLMTGGLRIGVSGGLVAKALAVVCGSEPGAIAHRLLAFHEPSVITRQALFHEVNRVDSLVPYPFFLAHSFEDSLQLSSQADEWRVEWKWDGIRAQVVKRAGGIALWSRGGELLTDEFPEFQPLAQILNDGVVLDGELVAWGDGIPAPFGDLQRRLNRRVVSKSILAKVPVRFIAYDLLELGSDDLRHLPLHERRLRLEELYGVLREHTTLLQLSPCFSCSSWQEVAALREQANEQHAEGVMLKHGGSQYGVGRTRGPWWKWKRDPYTVDAVLVYAQRGHGRRANLFTDYTFAVWESGQLIPFAKAYSGLSNAELREVDGIIRKTTIDSFGPVRAVQPTLVFEIAFEGIQLSKRHKSGVAVRFPRIHRWRRDKAIAEADSISALRNLVALE
jgi:DNA ligase-1